MRRFKPPERRSTPGGRFGEFVGGAVLLGIGTAMVYPTLLAAIGDVAFPSCRASAVGVYRLRRDLGYVVGALLAGISADAIGVSGAIWIVAGITALSGAAAAVRMEETRRLPVGVVKGVVHGNRMSC
jgi:MFS family permease